MMLEKEDLGLSLSLGFPRASSPPPPPLASFNPQNNSLSHHHIFPSLDRSSDTCRVEARPSFLRGIDVNHMPPSTAKCCEEEAGASSPNSTISTVSGKKREREYPVNGDELQEMGERACSREMISDEEDGGDASRKKLRLSKDQSALLEDNFKEHSTLNPKQKLSLAKRLGLRPRQVEVWFQNRRARTKLKQTEVDCEYLRRCYEKLTEENRRLQKEVQELRALKLSPNFFMQMTPPTTLTMCPSCEKVAAPPPSATTAAPPVDSPHPLRTGPTNHRPVSFNPWASTTIALTGK